MNRSKWLRMATSAAVTMGGASLVPVSSCTGELGVEFRTVAGDSIKQGVQSIVTGLVDGVFAVLEPDVKDTI